MSKISAIGNPVYDYIKTSHLETDGRVLSGCSTNFCLALAKLGVSTTLVGNVGRDFKSDFIIKLNQNKIKYQVFDSEQSGGFSLVYFGDKGERELKLLGEAGPIRDFPDDIADSDWLFIGPILGEIDYGYLKYIKTKTNARLFLDPQGILRYAEQGMIHHRKMDETEKIISLCEIVKPNELECKVLTGIDPREDYKTPAEMIKSWGAGMVIITIAEQGSIIYDGEEFYKIPAFQTRDLDPTGAGDTYAAGFMYGLIRGYALPDCGLMGASVASVMIENTGPDFPLTRMEMLDRFKATLSSI